MAIQIKLSDIKNHVGRKVKIFCKVLSSRSTNEFVIADQSDFKLLLVNEDFESKHLEIGNFVKILNPEISIKEGKENIKIGEKTSVFATSEISGIVTPPEDYLLMKTDKEPISLTPKIKIIDEMENAIKIASTFEMEKYQVIHNF